jgi:phage shock protein C
MTDKRLFRNTGNEVIAGVAGGIADYFNVDVTIVRILFVLAAIFGGWGLIIYIIFWIAVPRAPYEQKEQSYSTEAEQPYEDVSYESTTDFSAKEKAEMERKKRGSLIGGLVLIVIGSFFIVERYIPRFDFNTFWPFILVVVGFIILFSGFLNGGRNERNER